MYITLSYSHYRYDSQIENFDFEENTVRSFSRLVAACTMSKTEDHRAKPSDDLVRAMMSLMTETRDEETLEIMVTVLCVLNACFKDVPDTHQNLVLRACTDLDHYEKRACARGLMRALNTANEKISRLCLSFVRVLMDEKRTSHSFFYASDMNVMIDILVREIRDLPSQSLLRVDHLKTLEKILLLSSWFDTGQYGRADIAHALELVVHEYDNDHSFSKEAHDAVRSVLTLFSFVRLSCHEQITGK